MKQFTNLVADNVDFDIRSLCNLFWELHHSHPVLKGRIGGEDGFDVTIYLNKVLVKGTVLVASKDTYEELKVSDLSYGNLFNSNSEGAYCLKSRCWFYGENQLLEIFLNEEEAKFATKSSIQKFKTLEDAKNAFKDKIGIHKHEHKLIEVDGKEVILCGTHVVYEDIIESAFEKMIEDLENEFPELEQAGLDIHLDAPAFREDFVYSLLKNGVIFEAVYNEF